MQRLHFMVCMRPLNVEGAPCGDWRWWYWTDPKPGGTFATAEEAEEHFRKIHSTAEWEFEIHEILARRVK